MIWKNSKIDVIGKVKRCNIDRNIITTIQYAARHITAGELRLPQTDAFWDATFRR